MDKNSWGKWQDGTVRPCEPGTILDINAEQEDGRRLLATGKQVCTDCPFKASCDGSAECVGHSGGNLCEECTKSCDDCNPPTLDAYRIGETCELCPGKPGHTFIAAGVVFCIALLIIWRVSLYWPVVRVIDSLSHLQQYTKERLLRPKLEPKLRKYEVKWDDASAVIDHAFNLDRLKHGLEDPESFVNELLEAMGPIGKQILIEKLIQALEPKLQQEGLSTDDASQAFQLVETLDSLRDAIHDPEAFLKRLMEAGGAAGKKLALAKLRPKLEPKLEVHGLTYDDVLPALELIDTVEELEEAVRDPEALLKRLMEAGGAAGKKLALAKLRPKLEPKLEVHGLTYDDVLPALELIDTVEEL
eukprot:COSAG05_NODE_1577_length_4502_cov_3.764706_4_plen_358_part_01